jgi:hypothetical protein
MTFGLRSLGRLRSDGLATSPSGVSGALTFLPDGEPVGVDKVGVDALLPRLLLGVVKDCNRQTN